MVHTCHYVLGRRGKLASWVGFESGQLGWGLGWPVISLKIFLYKKTYICHLKNHVANYLM